jgi:hypothetical protein
MPGNCTDQDKKANRAKALAENAGKPEDKKKKYHVDVVVTIDSVVTDPDPKKELIKFTAPGANGNVIHTAFWHRSKKQVWAGCPSTLPSSATPTSNGALPAPDSEGILYLERDYVAAAKLYATRPKWPEELGVGPDVKDLKVALTSVVISGVELATGQRFPWTFDLMDPTWGGPDQSIVYSATSKQVTLSLTREAFEQFHAPYDAFLRLAEASAIIAAAKASPAQRAWAWSVVATCASMFAQENAHGRVTKDQKKLLQRLTDLDG